MTLWPNPGLTADPGAGTQSQAERSDIITLFLAGDVMLGRGVDQVLPNPSDPRLYEPSINSATDYVALAETANGPIPRPVDFAYVWGDALAELDRTRPDLRLINLETSMTTSEECLPKGINYRMNPANAPCLKAAGIDCCVLANNHLMDWGHAGLEETIKTLEDVHIKTAGAGRNGREAEAPAIFDISGKGRVIVFAFGSGTSGIPDDWAATENRPGVNLLPNLSRRSVGRIAEKVRAVKQPGDIVVASIHWGSNWGYGVPRAQITFAHDLIDSAGVDIVHGHSSHHPKAFEIYKGKPVLYGCGDFLNDYEGIGRHEQYRGELGLMYFPSFDPATGRLTRFTLTPTRIRKFRIQHAVPTETDRLVDVLSREGAPLGTAIARDQQGRLLVLWQDA